MKIVNRIILSGLFVLFFTSLSAQNKVKGTVFDATNGKPTPLPGVNVYWVGTQQGTVSDEKGQFSLSQTTESQKIVFSFVGFSNDTVLVSDAKTPIKHQLNQNITLGEVEVTTRAKTNFVSRMSTVNASTITSGELAKAACCNLSESFETSASVDVSYTDAVTGAKQIEMLGLSGIYSQMMAENMPNLRGLATSFGLAYVPGSWMESIQVSKGTSSVLNGYESISGQINVEYKKPETSERFFVNLFQNHMGRSEINFNTRIKVSPTLSTMVLAHGSMNLVEHDDNGDGFLDDPLTQQINFFNRWDYHGKNKEFKFGIKALTESRQGGQSTFDNDLPRDTTNGYGVNINTERAEAFLKTGFIFQRPATSLGIQQQFVYHHLNSFFGLNDYAAKQYSYYANALYQSNFGDSRHAYTTGFSFIYDRFDENLNDSVFGRTEKVPGVFYQYTYSDGHKLNVIAGIRADYHNLYGLFFTPRIHARYNFTESLILRVSAGKGSRSTNVLAENTSLLASSRKIRYLNKPDIEDAWNYGINFSKHFDLKNRELTLNIDAYRTDFTHQVVVDRDSDAAQILIYNLEGQSYSNSLQIEANYELIKGLDVTAAFRYNDVKMTFTGQLMEKPLINRYKGLVNLSYVTRLKRWQFDFTSQMNGPSRIPTTVEDLGLYKDSPSYLVLNAQLTRYFRQWNVYLGGENLTGYKQENPIISPEAPFSNAFDSSVIWGPISGIKVYAGLRYHIE